MYSFIIFKGNHRKTKKYKYEGTNLAICRAAED